MSFKNKLKRRKSKNIFDIIRFLSKLYLNAPKGQLAYELNRNQSILDDYK